MQAAPKALTYVFAMGILLAWLGALGIGAIEREWTPFTVATPIMGLAAGYVFPDVLGRKKGGSK